MGTNINYLLVLLYLQKRRTMKVIEKQFITDKKVKQISVIIPMKDYYFILEELEELEELEDIRLFDKAKKKKQSFVNAEDAFKAIENKRK